MFGGDGFNRLKPMGLRKLPLPPSWGISENLRWCGDVLDLDEASEQIVKLLVDSIEYEF